MPTILFNSAFSHLACSSRDVWGTRFVQLLEISGNTWKAQAGLVESLERMLYTKSRTARGEKLARRLMRDTFHIDLCVILFRLRFHVKQTVPDRHGAHTSTRNNPI